LRKKDGKDYSVLEVLENYAGRYRTGDKYIRVLFDCGIIYFLDKFGEKDISKAIDKIFIWAYTLRLQMQAVQIASIDNYALTNKKIFKKIREATRPNDIVNLKLEILNKNRSTKTNEIVELFEKMNYYDGK
jgi:hypothetical protein